MKTSLLLLVALAVIIPMRRRSAALRHWILAVAIVCAGILPLLEPLVPS